MSAAPNLPALLDFESQFEVAAQAVLAAAGVTAFIDQQKEKLPLLATAIGLDVGPAIDELTQLDPSNGGPALPVSWPDGQPPPQDYFRYTGNLEFRVGVPRDANGATLPGVDSLMGQIRGQVRAAMMRCVAPFTAQNLPWLRVTDIRPNGTSTGWEAALNTDYVSLRFALTWGIVPGAWPAWVES